MKSLNVIFLTKKKMFSYKTMECRINVLYRFSTVVSQVSFHVENIVINNCFVASVLRIRKILATCGSTDTQTYLYGYQQKNLWLLKPK